MHPKDQREQQLHNTVNNTLRGEGKTGRMSLTQGCLIHKAWSAYCPGPTDIFLYFKIQEKTMFRLKKCFRYNGNLSSFMLTQS